MGDFNCVLRNDKKKGGCEPRTSAINEFSDLLDDNNLFEADSLGSKYTWANGQSGVHRILCKLYLSIINEAWLTKFENWRCKDLPREVSDFMRMRLKADMKEWNLRVFGNINARLKHAKLTMEVALRISDEDPKDITKLNFAKDASVTLQEICMRQSIMLKKKSRNKWLTEGASNTSFFHANIRTRRSSNMISELVDDDGNALSDCDQIRDYTVSYFESKFIGEELPIDEQLFHYENDIIYTEESHRMDVIPTCDEIKAVVYDLGVDSAPGPDGFSGCFYRHCWDVIQQDLHSAITYCWQHKMIPNGVNSSLLILLAKGRNIHENISVASEMVNDLKTKCKDGNVGLKMDITQAFDTVSWSFVLDVFRRYGFSQHWCSWIYSVLSSARISILLNGSPEGFFKINRGLRQGDPLSPLIFVLIEDVLSRNLTKLFIEKKTTPMLSEKGISPTHLFFADDIMIFCKGNMKSLHNLLALLGKYQTASGQTVCHQKSKVYYGGGTLSRCRTIKDLLGMEVSTFPEKYLDVQIMRGAVKYHHVSNVVDKIKKQLSVWKGKMLSFQDRVVLINSVIASYDIHNTVVYKWPMKFIQQEERAIHNFLWYGDSEVARKSVVGYGKVCSVVQKEILGENDPDSNVMVSAFLNNNAWKLQGIHAQNLLRTGVDLNNLPMPQGGDDIRVWMPNMRGNFTISSTKQLIRKKYAILEVYGLLWRKVIHPNLAAQNWKLTREACANSDKIKSIFKINLANKCYLCKADEESFEHILWICSFAKQVWEWISGIFSLRAHYDLLTSYKTSKGRSRIVNDLWLLENMVTHDEIRHARNQAYFQNMSDNLHFFKQRVFHLIHDYSVRVKSFMHNSPSDLNILNFFRVGHRQVKCTQPVECFWSPPNRDELLLCCDGAAKGNPGTAGAGVVFRDVDCNFIGAMSTGLGRTNNFLAEIYAIIVGLEWALKWTVRKVWKMWRNIQNSYDSIRFVRTYREANFAADAMAKRGCLLRNGPLFLCRVVSDKVTPNPNDMIDFIKKDSPQYLRKNLGSAVNLKSPSVCDISHLGCVHDNCNNLQDVAYIYFDDAFQSKSKKFAYGIMEVNNEGLIVDFARGTGWCSSAEEAESRACREAIRWGQGSRRERLIFLNDNQNVISILKKNNFVVNWSSKAFLLQALDLKKFLASSSFKTAKTKIDVGNGTLTMDFDKEIIRFNIFEVMRYPNDVHSAFSIDVTGSLAREMFDLSNEYELGVVLRNNMYLDAPKLELKPLPYHLKYSYLGDKEELPLIVSKNLTVVQEERLFRALKEHKTTIG
ncbi:uncharacterized protein LOC113294922 [Papaver somniferum]|uniref:uncharacterized protein LOC113294922 n=1 Tax=Papaver somniferum TaxID=3469 RepID=UPI000E6F5E8A|nr:uncharacterized protein LOC113294922 [Papaver somniferum]